MSNTKSLNAKVFSKFNLDCAFASIPSPSNMFSAISTPSAAKAISKLSVPEHIAKRNPPPAQNSLIRFATANFISLTFLKPFLAAAAS